MKIERGHLTIESFNLTGKQCSCGEKAGIYLSVDSTTNNLDGYLGTWICNECWRAIAREVSEFTGKVTTC